MWERLRNWLSDDAVEERDDRGWGRPLLWGVTIVALFTVAIAWCHAPAATDNVADPADTNLLDLIDSRPELSFFRDLITVAGLEEAIAVGQDITFFAPTDAAFAAMPAELIDAMTTNGEIALEVLRIHVAQGKLGLDDLVSSGSTQTAAGLLLSIAEQGGTVTVDIAAVINGDLEAMNGTVHTIDATLGLGDHG
jgi:uncharacterized surface protein with fasciclin (FAS1) repeats